MLAFSLEDIMDIYTAAKYMKVRYRIRRISWDPAEYLEEIANMFIKLEVSEYTLFSKDAEGEFKKQKYLNKNFGYDLNFNDLLAEDWEIITSGTCDKFSSCGHVMYEGE